MTMASHAFSQLAKGLEKWSLERLLQLKKSELQGQALLLSAPGSGTRQVLAERLLEVYSLRIVLGRYGNDPDDLVKDFKRRDLYEMCKSAKLFRSGNKRLLATVLLNWRNRSRTKGQKVLHQCREEGAKLPKQFSLKLR